MTRKDLEEYTPQDILEGLGDSVLLGYDNVQDLLNDVENRINDILKGFESINSVADLDQIEHLVGDLKSISNDLY